MHARTITAVGLIIAIGLIPLLPLDLESGGLMAGLQVRPEQRSRGAPLPLRTSSLAELPLLEQSALSYVGAFSVPRQDDNGHPLTWGGYALTYDPDRQGFSLAVTTGIRGWAKSAFLQPSA